jgi:glycosyltransferase involved in cell wall biosynthesis
MTEMKVLHIYRTYFPDPPGGLQEAIRQICLGTKAHGVDNTVFALSPNPDPKTISRDEANVVRARSWFAPASCDIGGLEALSIFRHEVQQADVIHYLFPWPFADLLHQTVGVHKPSVLTYISDIVRQRSLNALYSPLMWRTLMSMRAIVSNAPNYASSSRVLSDPRLQNQLRQIPLGIDEASYPKQGDDSIFSRLGIENKSPYFLFVGVLRYYKGLQYLIEAASKINAQIVVAGSGPMEQSLVNQTKLIGATNVIFAGQVSECEKIALIKHCKALVLPSHLRSEAYGMVLVEASMFGKPMISCEIGTGTSFVNQHQETGFVVQPESPNQLAQAMNKLLCDDALTERFGRTARQRYESLFSGAALGKAYADLYRHVIEKGGSNADDRS